MKDGLMAKALGKVSQGKVSHVEKIGNAPAHYVVKNRMFHPDQRPYAHARREGMISVSLSGEVALTEHGTRFLSVFKALLPTGAEK